MILCKSSVLLDELHFSQVLRLSWELLLDQNEDLAACAGKDQDLLSFNGTPHHLGLVA